MYWNKKSCYGFNNLRKSGFDFGDRNTKYYHMVINVCKMMNNHFSICNSNGEVVEDREITKNMVLDFYTG